MIVQLGALHYIYLILILLIFLFMILKKDITLICIAGIFAIGFIATGSFASSIAGVFNSFVYAVGQLLDIILVIAAITSMGIILTKTGINEAMAYPFTKLMKTPALAYWIIGLLMMIMSLFFWPSPAVALIGAILVPAAVKAGLPAIGAAIAMNIFGHGVALSGDFVIQGAPKLTAGGAGIPVGSVISASVPLVIFMGVLTTTLSFVFLRKDMKNGTLVLTEEDFKHTEKEDMEFEKLLTPNTKKMFAVFVSIMFALDIYLMCKLNLQGGDASALIGGTSMVIMTIITIYVVKKDASSHIISYIVEGLLFGFKVFGPVIPIAAFFYLGDAGFVKIFGEVLPKTSTGLVNDLGLALANTVPINAPVGAITLTSVGVITGLDGSGFSGISLAGSVAKIFGTALGKSTATLTALGQLGAIWVGGGTIIPWALLPAAAICKIDPFELARRNLKPVAIGLIATTIFAMFLL